MTVVTTYFVKLKRILRKAWNIFGAKGFTGMIVIVLYHYLFAGCRPTLYYLKSRRNKAIVGRIKGLKNYRPAPLVRNCHLMTGWLGMEIAAVDFLGFAPFPALKNVKRQYLPCKGNQEGPWPGIITLNWGFTQQQTKKGTVILIPGMGNDFNSSYIRRCFMCLIEEGFDAVVYEPRGLKSNLRLLTTPQSHGIGFTGDLRQAVAHICEKSRASYGESHRVFAAGWSMGSAYLSLYAGEEGEKCPLNGIAALSCPVDLTSTSKRISRTFFGVYQWAIFQGMKDKLKSPEHQRALQLLRDHGYAVDKAMATQSLFAMDTLIAAQMWGYDNIGEYYRNNSPALYFSKIRIPCLLINARDDPMADTNAFFIGDFISNENIIGVKTDHGGHSLAWFEGWLWPTSSWINRVLKDYFNALVDFSDEPLTTEELEKGLKFSRRFKGLNGRVNPRAASVSKL